MKTTTQLWAALAAGSVLVISLAQAETAADRHFKMMDADADGKVSRTEHAEAAKKMFAECDANRDGIVTAQEMDAATARRGQEVAADTMSSTDKIAVIDENRDGQLTTAEHETGTETMFGKMDTNRDGFLSQEETAAAMQMKKKPR